MKRIRYCHVVLISSQRVALELFARPRNSRRRSRGGVEESPGRGPPDSRCSGGANGWPVKRESDL